MSKPSPNLPEVVKLTAAELEGLYHRLESSNLSDNDKRLFKGLAQAYIWLKHKYVRISGIVNSHFAVS